MISAFDAVLNLNVVPGGLLKVLLHPHALYPGGKKYG